MQLNSRSLQRKLVNKNFDAISGKVFIAPSIESMTFMQQIEPAMQVS
ncbi:hypothetical protein [uncultured Treponema sp.]|nr:hypothetical protein [uncultured Treponema sp.]